MTEPIERFADEVTINFEELRAVLVGLDTLVDELGTSEAGQRLDVLIGRMLRWISPLLRDLDEE